MFVVVAVVVVVIAVVVDVVAVVDVAVVDEPFATAIGFYIGSEEVVPDFNARYWCK